MKARREATFDLRTAHDVRRLQRCSKCNELGDGKYMPKVNGAGMHGFCALDVLGVAGVANLPVNELHKIALGEIGATAMRQICEAIERRALTPQDRTTP